MVLHGTLFTMTAIAGYVNFSGQPADERVVRRMLATMPHRGLNGSATWVKAEAALGHAALHTTPEHRHERQPLLDESGSVCLVLDGRVDNREELRTAIEAKGSVLRDESDAELVLKAYLTWGEECPARIIGDFAFAVWNGRQKTLFAARDTYWCRPFYYYLNEDCFVFGSEIQSVLAHPAVPAAVNEGMLAEYLASALTSDEETLYVGVKRLPASHSFLITNKNISRRRYWDVAPGREIRYRDDEDYAEHYRELLRECVRCRLRSDRPVGADLSGGMDSSSIVAMVMALRQQGTGVDGFATYSVSFPGVPAADETTYIRDVQDFWNLDGNILVPGPRPLEWYLEQVKRYRDHPEYPNGSYTDAVREAGSQRGHRVMLTGVGGDELFTGNYFHYADMFRGLRLVAMWKQYQDDKRNEALIGRPALIACGPRQLIPDFAKRLIRPFRSAPNPPSWINPDFAARTNLLDRIHAPISSPEFRSHVQRAMYRNLASGWTRHSEEMDERSSAWFGIEQRHPFRDRRMVEFGFAIPESQRWRGIQTKFLMRQAMKGHLPVSVTSRLGKADLSHPFPDTAKSIGMRELLTRMTVGAKGWVQEEAVLSVFDTTIRKYEQRDSSYPQHMWALWNVFGVELLANIL